MSAWPCSGSRFGAPIASSTHGQGANAREQAGPFNASLQRNRLLGRFRAARSISHSRTGTGLAASPASAAPLKHYTATRTSKGRPGGARPLRLRIRAARRCSRLRPSVSMRPPESRAPISAAADRRCRPMTDTQRSAMIRCFRPAHLRTSSSGPEPRTGHGAQRSADAYTSVKRPRDFHVPIAPLISGFDPPARTPRARPSRLLHQQVHPKREPHPVPEWKAIGPGSVGPADSIDRASPKAFWLPTEESVPKITSRRSFRIRISSNVASPPADS